MGGVHSPVVKVLPHGARVYDGYATLTMPHSAVDTEHLAFLRRNDEASPWEVLEGAGHFKEGSGRLQLSSFSLFSIGRLFSNNGPEHVMCRTYVPVDAELQSGNKYVAKVLAYLQHDEHEVVKFISDDDKDLDGQKRVQAWKNMQLTMIADMPTIDEGGALQLCSEPVVKVKWDGGCGNTIGVVTKALADPL